MKTDQKQMQCPQCQKGMLIDIQAAEVVKHIFDINPERMPDGNFAVLCGTETLIEEIGRPYIGCTNCDFMGSSRDVLDLIKENKAVRFPLESRYIAYEIAAMPSQFVQAFGGQKEYHLSGILKDPNGHPLPAGIYEVICPFKDEAKARDFVYKIAGISGVPGQKLFLVE
jgi:hypothetical protein